MAFVGVWVLAWIINALAPTFEATRNPVQAMKVAAYSATAAWVAGVFQIVPSLGWIGAILGLYSLYLLYLGLPILMKAPAAKAMAYTLATIVARSEEQTSELQSLMRTAFAAFCLNNKT